MDALLFSTVSSMQGGADDLLAPPWVSAEREPLNIWPPVHSTTEMFSSTLQSFSWPFYSIPAPLFPLRDDDCGKTWILNAAHQADDWSSCVCRAQGCPLEEITGFNIRRGGGGTRCLFFCPQKLKLSPENTNHHRSTSVQQPADQDWRSTLLNTHANTHTRCCWSSWSLHFWVLVSSSGCLSLSQSHYLAACREMERETHELM